jgi:hypothetical protein
MTQGNQRYGFDEGSFHALSLDEHIHLIAAEGFIGLGMYLDADATLDDIDPYMRSEITVVSSGKAPERLRTKPISRSGICSTSLS